MIELGEQLSALLSELDSGGGPGSEAAVADTLREMAGSAGTNASDEDRSKLEAEWVAFSFMADYQGEAGWETYYGPFMEWIGPEGQRLCSPDIKQVNPAVLTHWQTRLDQAVRPFVRLRYADLLWDLSWKAAGITPDVRHARIVVDATVELIERRDYTHEIDGIKKLKRALSVALQIGDKERIEAAAYAMILFEDAIADDAMAGLWGFSLDNLVGNKKIPLSVERREKLVNDMEARLQRICDTSDTSRDPLPANMAAMHLLRYYRRESRHEDARRVLRLMGTAYVAAANAVSPLVGSAWLRELFDIYHTEGMVDDADALAPRMAELAARASEEMQAHSVEISIPNEEIEQYVMALTEGSLEEVLSRLTWSFVPDPEDIATHLKQEASQFPFQALVSHVITDHEGRAIATVGSIESDLHGRVVWRMSQEMSFMIPFLRLVIERVFTRLEPSREAILEYLYQSPLFIPGGRDILSSGLDRYIAGDHISAAHILAPQIEAALRNLLRLAGGGLYKPHRAGGQQLKNLNDILDDSRVRERLGSRVVAYLSCLLADSRGWNLRNEVSHGILPAGNFGPGITDRLFHVLLLLGQLRIKPGANAGEEDEREGNDDAVENTGATTGA